MRVKVSVFRTMMPAALLLGGLTLGVFWPATGHQFTELDDYAYILENEHVLGGLTREGVRWALGSIHSENWHPLTTLSHMLDVQLFGVSPAGHHLTGIILHALNAGLLFAVLTSMTGAFRLSFLVAALFGLHPLRVESVVWVSERKDVLSAFFWILAMGAYLGYVRRRGPWRYGLTAALFILGLMSKPMVVTFPLALLLLDYWPLGRWRFPADRGGFGRLVLEKVPLLVLSAASAAVTFLAQRSAGAVIGLGDLPFAHRLANVPMAYARYLKKTVLPTDLAIYYPYPIDQLSGRIIWIAVGLLIALTVWVARRAGTHPFLAVGWLWFLGTLVPVIGLVQVGEQSMAGLVRDRPRLQPVFACSAGVLIAALVILTHVQIGYWKDNQVLYSRALRVTWDNPVVRYALGLVYRNKGDQETAERHFRAAVAMAPLYLEARNSLGRILLDQDKIDEAISHFRAVLEKAPRWGKARHNLALALEMKEMRDGALWASQEPFRDDPTSHGAAIREGYSMLQQGKGNLAQAAFEEALRMDPGSWEARRGLGLSLLETGRDTEAIDLLREVAGQRPDSSGAHYELGLALAKAGRVDEAFASYEEAVRLDPSNVEARTNLGNLYARDGLAEKAMEQYREALRLRPGDAIAHNSLGVVLAGLGRYAEAEKEFREALRLKPDYENARENMTKAISERGR